MIATGLFDAVLAQEIRREFSAALSEGLSAYAAGERILERHAASLNDPDNGPIIYYALAALQMEQCVISTKIRKRALTYINSGDGLERWTGAPPDVMKARRDVEQSLRVKLIGMG